MWPALILTLCAFDPSPASWQQSRPVGDAPGRATSTEKEGESNDALEAEFYALLRVFENAHEGYLFDLREARQLGKAEADWPRHPSSLYYDQFLALAERGSPWGMAWLLENVQFRHVEPAAQVARSKFWYERLFREAPDHDSLLRATRRLPAATRAFGREYVLDLLAELLEKTTRAEVKGNVLWALGTTMRSAGPETSEADERGAIALFEQLVQSYPEAPLASDAALVLYPFYQAEFLRELTEWVDALEHDLNTEVLCPIDASATRMETLARTGILQARQWYEDFYRRWSAERSRQQSALTQASNAPELLLLADQCSLFQGSLQGAWIDLMLRLRSLVVTHWSSSQAVQEDLERFVTHCFHRPYAAATLSPFFEELAGAELPASLRADVEFGRALVLERGAELEQLEQSLAAYQCLLDDGIERSWEDLAQREVETLTNALPGSRLELKGRGPDGELVDVAQFRGSIVLVDFFSFNNDRCDERLRQQAEQLRLWQDKPVVLVGVCFESLVKASFHMKAEEHGVTWPCISDLGLRGQFASKWHVRHFPTAIVLDREGVIVTRNRPWPETVAAIERLFEN